MYKCLNCGQETKLRNIYKNTKISSIQQGQINIGWHPIKDYQHEWKQESLTKNEEENKSFDTNTKLTQMLELKIKHYNSYYNCIHMFKKLTRDVKCVCVCVCVYTYMLYITNRILYIERIYIQTHI